MAGHSLNHEATVRWVMYSNPDESGACSEGRARLLNWAIPETIHVHL